MASKQDKKGLGTLWRKFNHGLAYSSFKRRAIPNMRAAMNAVLHAKANGQLLPASNFKCVDCGRPAEHYDHRDYLKPLDVDPVCRSCNSLRGPAQNADIDWSFINSVKESQ